MGYPKRNISNQSTPITDEATFNIPIHGASGTGLRSAVVPRKVACELECKLNLRTKAHTSTRILVKRLSRELVEALKQRDRLATAMKAIAPMFDNESQLLDAYRDEIAQFNTALATVPGDACHAVASAPKLPPKNTYYAYGYEALKGGSFYRSTGRKREAFAHYNLGDFVGFVKELPDHEFPVIIDAKTARNFLPYFLR